MDTLDELIFIINRHLNVDLCESSREHPNPWARTIFVVLAYRYTDYDPQRIMNRAGLHRTSFHPRIRYHQDKFGLDAEYSDIFKEILLKTNYLGQQFKEKKEQERKSMTLVQSELQKLHTFAKNLRTMKPGKSKNVVLKEMRESISLLEELELERIQKEQ